jgi:hypothetical protein
VAKLRFVRAAFFIDRAVAHVHRHVAHSHGNTVTITTVNYGHNRTRLKVACVYGLDARKSEPRRAFHKTVIRHRHRATVTISTTLSMKFRLC